MENRIYNIYRKYKKNAIDKKAVTDQIVSIIDHIQNHKERYEAVKTLGKLDLKDKELFPLLESLLLSDSNEKIRIAAAKIIRNDFLNLAYKPMKWALSHESSPHCLKIIHETLIKVLKNGTFETDLDFREFLIEEINNIENKEIRVGFKILQEKNTLDSLTHNFLIKILINYYTLVYLERAYWRVKYTLENFEIVKLDFIFKGLTIFPSALRYLTSLKSLIFRYNQISSIPEWIGELGSLEVLNFNVNELQKLPKSIGKLKSLKELYLWKNNIEKIPNSIGSLQELEVLNLRLNYITHLPSSIGDINSLRELNLHDNKLNYLPESIGKLDSLEKLNLSWNYLQDLPKTIGNLHSLKSLDLGRNELEKLPETIGKLKKLKSLNLSENNLNILPESIKDLTNLRDLNLARNNLSSLPVDIISMPNLEELYVGENSLDSFSSKIKNLELSGVKVFF